MILKLLERFSPQQNLLLGFTLYILIGALLLYMPFSQKGSISFLDALFMSASAVSTTGLATVSTYDSFNNIGQSVIILLIQIGGIGYMTFSSFLILTGGQKLMQWRQKLLNTEFSLPQNFILKDFLKATIYYTIIIELVGMIALFITFKLYDVETTFALRSSFFHSISAFCTAGFGLYNDSFEQFKYNIPINIILSVLSILGALGFIVATDIYYKFTKTNHLITFTTKIIVSVFTILTTAGTLFMVVFEQSIQQETLANKIMISFFQVTTAITTAGFNTIPIGGLTTAVLLIIIFMMYVGASPAGTGGGLKSTTLTACIAIVVSHLKGSVAVFFMNKQIPRERVSIAAASIILYTFLLFIGTLVLLCSEVKEIGLDKMFFEVASALGTVGLSTGITSNLSVIGKLTIIFLMFAGRVGVINLGLALLKINDTNNVNTKTNDNPENADLVV